MRIMAWNLENFKREDLVWGLRYGAPQIMKMLYPGGVATPVIDVFGVIEVYNRTGGGPPGRPLPANSLGTEATILLYNELRGKNNATTEWRLVPPLSLGDARRDEGVAVFYNAKKVQFQGPNQWYPARGESLPPQPGLAAGEYPVPWSGYVGAPYFAAKVKFYMDDTDLTTEITFPDNSHRRPFLVRFREVVGGKTIDVLFFHTSPPFRADPDAPQNPAYLACSYLGLVPEVTNPTHDGVYATVVIGDLNVDANHADRWNNALGTVTAWGYQPLLPVTIPGQRAVPTMSREKDDVQLPPDPIPVPVCNQYYWRKFAIDNAIWGPPTVAAQGCAIDLTRETVTPFQTWPKLMEETITQIHTSAWPGSLSVFKATRNWFQMRQRSDHVPVVISI